MAHDQRKRISLAQNFLIRSNLARRIIERAQIESDDLVIEIGPGRGALTRSLAATCRQVIAIEKDGTLARRLGQEVQALGNVAIFEGDFFDLPLPVTPYKVVANIPFNVTAAIIDRLTSADNGPESATLVVRREAAERFMGHPRRTLAALLLAPWFELSVADQFRRQDFVPPPRVDVVLLRFSKRGPPLVGTEEAREYRDFVSHVFTAWMPTIGDALGTFLPRDALMRLAAGNGTRLGLKPSEVPFEQWLSLFRAFKREATAEQRRAVDGAEARLRAQQARLEKRRRTRVQ